MAQSIRVRYAPSPTGYPHIGNVRTALFNWLFARHSGGKFIVRIEDTDQDRMVSDAVDVILDGLEWLGIDWDEGPRVGGPYGPYFQSQRLDRYREMAQVLVRQGRAYPCFCTRERLARLRDEQQKQQQAIGYDGQCRRLSEKEVQDLEAEGAPSVIRFAMPADGITQVHDIIRGEVEWQNELLDDFILIKSDGFPTYHLANVADDHLMEISHVLRAEEWLSSTPRHLQLYQALGFTPPRFGHLPMILGPDRAKLSKRHGATSILEYRDQGYLPGALLNFMVLLGWSLDDHTQVMPLETIVENFSLERVGRPAAIFDWEKLQWMNGVYIRELSAQELTEQVLPFLERDLPASLQPVDRDYLVRIAPLIQERLKLLSDAPEMTRYFFQEELEYSPQDLVQRGMDAAGVLTALRRALDDLSPMDTFEHSALEERLRAAATDLDLSPRQFFGVLRMAATGRTASPPLFETMEVLGKARVLRRIQRAIDRMESSGEV